MTNYQTTKKMLQSHAEDVKFQFIGDKAAIRQSINDYTDTIGKDYDLNDYQKNLLANYACKLHPKK